MTGHLSLIRWALMGAFLGWGASFALMFLPWGWWLLAIILVPSIAVHLFFFGTVWVFQRLAREHDQPDHETTQMGWRDAVAFWLCFVSAGAWNGGFSELSRIYEELT